MRLYNINLYNFIFYSFILSFAIGTAIMNVLCIIFIIFSINELRKEKKIHFYFSQTWFLIALFLYFFILFLCFYSQYFNENIFKCISLIRFPLLALSTQYFIEKNPISKNFIGLLSLILLLFISFDSLVQYFTNINLFGNKIDTIYDNRKRLTSIFGSEEIVGSFIVKMMFLTFLCNWFYKKKNINICIFIFFGFIILITQERMAFLLYILSFTLIMFYNLIFYEKKKSLILFLVIPILFFGVIYKDQNLQNRFLTTFKQHDNQQKEQINLDLIKNSLWGAHFYAAKDIFLNHKFFGSGPRSFRFECKKEKYEDPSVHYNHKRCSTHPHNYILEILSENGLIFTVFYLFLTLKFLINGLKKIIKKTNGQRDILFLALIVNLWPIGTSGSIYSSMNASIIFLYIGIYISMRNLTKSS